MLGLGSTELTVAALATWHIVEVWHHSHLTATARARVELWEGWAGQLLSCPFCLSAWVAGAVVLGLLLPTPTGESADALNGLLVLTAIALLAAVAVLAVWVLRVSREMLHGFSGRTAAYFASVFGVPALVLVSTLILTLYGCWKTGWWLPAAAVKVVILTLAVARLANLGNDLTHRWCRTPRLESTFEEGTSVSRDPDDVR